MATMGQKFIDPGIFEAGIASPHCWLASPANLPAFLHMMGYAAIKT
jgi:hypothetical protein